MTEWQEIADRVFARRYDELDLTVGLVLGTAECLVVDSRGDNAQGAELARAVREVTNLPWQLSITHAHFDHCFGTAAFKAARVWAQKGCADHLHRTAEQQRREWVEYYRARGDFRTSEELSRTVVQVPDHLVATEHELALGGRTVRLIHPGAGHTDHDLIVSVPDCGAVFAGDLVENGAPPDFSDARPKSWPSTLDALLALRPAVVVPGHGAAVEPEFVAAQRAEIARVAELADAVERGSITAQEAATMSPYPADTTRAAFRAFRRAR